ncbi:hydroxyacylglutathione hydrolase [Tianweitania sp.]|uniref:hydroxyacylglutathione hydrolase n=1 Tax=Tianweitania sp. TaxID=2021634 RepID=UPI0028A2D144|nr:hydroxyacylglutathione hydrolase [Tianweitania sp.]
MPLSIEQFICRSDNYGVLVHDPDSEQTLIIDAPEEKPIVAAIERTGWKPTMLLITHHHADHVAGNLGLKQRYGMPIYGPAAERDNVPGIDETYDDGHTLSFGAYTIHVVSTPGHTAGHVSLFFPEAKLAFTGDTLFAMGCGRLLECQPPVMFESLKKIAEWPRDTVVYCGHEYTEANARFALSVDPENEVLQRRAKEVERLRASREMTLPTTIGDELDTNPFLRWADPSIRKVLGMEEATDSGVFAELRRRKDEF